jgi:hypothetical protein
VELLFHTNGIRGLHSSVENLVSQTVGLHATDAAVLYARAGDITRAAELLANAYADRDLHLIQLRYNSRAPEALLHNPRWLAIWKQPLLRDWQRYHDRIAAELIARSGR